MKRRFTGLVAKGSHIIQYDAAVFSPKQFCNKHWALKNRALPQPTRFPKGDLVIVMGFISVEEGAIQFFCQKKRAFNSHDVVGFFETVSRMFPDDDLIFFGDNAKIHISGYTH